MSSEVKMPQLGMNQDSAVIVSWLKSSGDAIAAGDALCEVETDKATVEVEAPADGFLSNIAAPEGTDVPVGDVIALIVGSKAEVADTPQAPVSDQPGPDPEPAASASMLPEPTEPVEGPAPSVGTPMPAAGKVLASPKARRLAKEVGIALSDLRAQGVPEPIHAADLSALPAGGQSSLTARVDGTAFAALLARSEDADRALLLAAFAAGAWRAVFAAEDVGITVKGLDGAAALHPNPDRGGEGPETSALTLVDLCGTRLSAYAPATGGTTLSTAQDGETYTLTLAFSEARLPMAHAIALLDAIAARVNDPIRQLL